ncbi:hypothetical protein FW756_01055 [Leucobacter sp. 1207-22]
MFVTRIRTVVLLDCSADIAWGAVHDPAVAAQLYRPMLQMRPKAGRQFPREFVSGSQIDVGIYFLGRFCVGSQRIAIEDSCQATCASAPRTMQDVGKPLSGPLALLRYWHHEISIKPASSYTSIWKDELTVGGFFAPLFFVFLQGMWRWRGVKLRKLARLWAKERF